MKKIIKNENVSKIFHQIYKSLIVILGTFILSFGSAVFIVPFDIINGGLTGLGLIFLEIPFLNIDIDILITIMTWILFFIGLIFLGIKFSLKTLLSTIFYPVFISLLLRCGVAQYIVSLLVSGSNIDVSADSGILVLSGLENLDIGVLIISGVIGGAFTGIGCGITFIAGGSTGGLDVLAFILNKYTAIKTSAATLIFDGLIVVSGIFIGLFNKSYGSYKFIASLIGIISAVICSLMIEFIYIKQQGAYFADVITDKSEEIKNEIIKKLDRSVTIYNVKGGYTNENKICVRIIFQRNELLFIKDMIAEIDKNAFLIIGDCAAVNGEGFNPINSSKSNTLTEIKKLKEKK